MKRIAVVLFTMFALALAGTNNDAMAFDNELIPGGSTWWNNVCKGNHIYVEDTLWIDGAYSPGIGAYAAAENGESKITAYEWDGHLVGPQVGAKHTWSSISPYYDANKVPVYLLRQWQVKLRYVMEETSGDNKTSGYHMTQKDTKAGGYFEFVGQLDPKWTASVQVEGWKTLTKERKSTWSDDQPENRDSATAGLFLQYKFSDPLSTKFGAILFWQGWDDMSGARVQGEARLYEHLMAGPFVSIPFGVPDVYKELNAKIADLVTIGIYGRFEF